MNDQENRQLIPVLLPRNEEEQSALSKAFDEARKEFSQDGPSRFTDEQSTSYAFLIAPVRAGLVFPSFAPDPKKDEEEHNVRTLAQQQDDKRWPFVKITVYHLANQTEPNRTAEPQDLLAPQAFLNHASTSKLLPYFSIAMNQSALTGFACKYFSQTLRYYLPENILTEKFGDIGRANKQELTIVVVDEDHFQLTFRAFDFAPPVPKKDGKTTKAEFDCSSSVTLTLAFEDKDSQQPSNISLHSVRFNVKQEEGRAILNNYIDFERKLTHNPNDIDLIKIGLNDGNFRHIVLTLILTGKINLGNVLTQLPSEKQILLLEEIFKHDLYASSSCVADIDPTLAQSIFDAKVRPLRFDTFENTQTSLKTLSQKNWLNNRWLRATQIDIAPFVKKCYQNYTCEQKISLYGNLKVTDIEGKTHFAKAFSRALSKSTTTEIKTFALSEKRAPYLILAEIISSSLQKPQANNHIRKMKGVLKLLLDDAEITEEKLVEMGTSPKQLWDAITFGLPLSEQLHFYHGKNQSVEFYTDFLFGERRQFTTAEVTQTLAGLESPDKNLVAAVKAQLHAPNISLSDKFLILDFVSKFSVHSDDSAKNHTDDLQTLKSEIEILYTLFFPSTKVPTNELDKAKLSPLITFSEIRGDEIPVYLTQRKEYLSVLYSRLGISDKVTEKKEESAEIIRKYIQQYRRLLVHKLCELERFIHEGNKITDKDFKEKIETLRSLELNVVTADDTSAPSSDTMYDLENWSPPKEVTLEQIRTEVFQQNRISLRRYLDLLNKNAPDYEQQKLAAFAYASTNVAGVSSLIELASHKDPYGAKRYIDENDVFTPINTSRETILESLFHKDRISLQHYLDLLDKTGPHYEAQKHAAFAHTAADDLRAVSLENLAKLPNDPYGAKRYMDENNALKPMNTSLDETLISLFHNDKLSLQSYLDLLNKSVPADETQKRRAAFDYALTSKTQKASLAELALLSNDPYGARAYLEEKSHPGFWSRVSRTFFWWTESNKKEIELTNLAQRTLETPNLTLPALDLSKLAVKVPQEVAAPVAADPIPAAPVAAPAPTVPANSIKDTFQKVLKQLMQGHKALLKVETSTQYDVTVFDGEVNLSRSSDSDSSRDISDLSTVIGGLHSPPLSGKPDQVRTAAESATKEVEHVSSREGTPDNPADKQQLSTARREKAKARGTNRAIFGKQG